MLCIDVELVFGFSPPEYEIHESNGSVSIDIVFIYGIPGDYQPLVFVSIHNGSAIG